MTSISVIGLGVEDLGPKKIDLTGNIDSSLKKAFGDKVKKVLSYIVESSEGLDPQAVEAMKAKALTHVDLQTLGTTIDANGEDETSAALIVSKGSVPQATILLKNNPPKGPYESIKDYTESLIDEGSVTPSQMSKHFDFQKYGVDLLRDTKHVKMKSGKLVVFKD